MPRVAIFGAGVGGLSAAHELSKLPNYQIDIYEKKDAIGGLARSDRDQDGCATEYCWRVYFDFYNNLFRTMSEIPLQCSPDHKSVLNNLTIYRHTNIRDTPFAFADSAKGVYNILKGFASCDQRLDAMDSFSWHGVLDSESKSVGNPLLHIGGWLGMDRLKGSYKSVVKVGMEMQIMPSYICPGYKDWITTMPTSEAWFDHWMSLLRSRGVRFHFNSALTQLNGTNTMIQSAIVNGNTIVTADQYVLAVPIESLTDIVNPDQGFGGPGQTPQITLQDPREITLLRDTCLHTQLSYQIYFNRPVSLGPFNAFLIVDSPWDLIVLSYDATFKQAALCTKIPKAKGGWSVAACTAYTPGILFGKPMNQCSEKEIYAELWAQMARSKTLQKLVLKNNGFALTPDIVLKWSPVWPTFQASNGSMSTSEPKFTNNAGSAKLRPSFKTRMTNLYIATGYVRETIDIFSMEAANIAGRRVAHEIDNRCPKPFNLPRPLLTAPLRALDTPLYYLGLPDAFTVLLIIFIAATLFAIIYLASKLS